MVGEVGVLARAAGLAVLAVRDDVELVLLAGDLVDVGLAPRIERHFLAQVGAVPLRLGRRLLEQRLQPELGARVTADVQAVLVERLLQRVDLRLRGVDLGLADLAEVARRDEADQQADDRDDDQQLEQRETLGDGFLLILS